MKLIGLVGILATVIWIGITIYSGKKVFFQSNLFDNLKDGDRFFLDKLGNYTVWIKVKSHKLNRLLIESPIILDDKGKEIELKKILLVNANTLLGGTRKSPIYNFEAKNGYYEFGIIDRPYSKENVVVANKDSNLETVHYMIRTRGKIINYFGFIMGVFVSISFFILTILSFSLDL